MSRKKNLAKISQGAGESQRSRRTDDHLEQHGERFAPPTKVPAQRRSYTSWLGRLLFLILAPFLAYSPLTNAGFIWDDDQYVTENQTLRTADGLRRIWFEPLSIPQFYPLVHTTYWIEYRLWEVHPLGYHLVNVLLHGLSCVLLWYFLMRLQVPGAWLAAAIFAVHPVMVESVAWITERKNVLSLPLALASMHFLLSMLWRQDGNDIPQKRWLAYTLALLLFVTALLSKTVVCTVPAVMLVIIWWKTGRIDRTVITRLIPFFVIGIALGLVTVWLEKHHVGAKGAEWSLSMLDRILLAGRNLWFYISKIIWPHPLIFFYPRWSIDASQAWQYLFPVAFGLLLCLLWFAKKRIGRGPLAAVLIFAGVLFPALGFFDVYPFRYSFVADHFQYHASIGLITLISAIASTAVWHLKDSILAIGKIAACVILLLLGVLTYQQTQSYMSVESIFLDTLKKNPAAWGASVNLVKLYVNNHRLGEALELAQQAVQLSPHIADTHNDLGGVLAKLGVQNGVDVSMLERAVRCFQETIRIEPNYNEAYFNLANILQILGRNQEAAAYFERLLELAPHDTEATLGLAQSLTQLNQLDRASNLYRKVLDAEPQNPVALHRLGMACATAGKWDEAISYFETALRNNPQLTDVRNDLASAYVAKQNYQAAKAQYEMVIQAQPNNVVARNNLGVVFMRLGETRLAIEQFQTATQLAPEYTEAKSNLERARNSLNSP